MSNNNRTAFRISLGIAVVLSIGILVLVNWVGNHRYRRFDWTRAGLYSLSDKTEKVLKTLKAPVNVTVLMTEGSPLYGETREVLNRYKAASPLVTVEFLDPTRNRARAELLVKEFGVRGATVVFKSGDKKKYVTEDQLAELDFSRAQMGGEPTIKAFKGEQEFTSAILSVTQAKSPKVIFTTGHNERKFDNRGREGYFSLAETLRRDNCIVEEWQSLGAADVPAGTDCVIIAQPKTPFTESETAVLKKYLQDGGRALLFLDVELAAGGVFQELGLKPLLADFGVRVDDDIVVDPANALPMMSADTVFSKAYRPHAITKLLEGLPIVLRLTRSVGIVEKPAAGLIPTVLVETSAQGWGETNLKNPEKVEKDEADVKGPVPLAVAVDSAPNAEKKKTRLVVFGDSDFASNSGLAEAANLYLLNGAANWVLEREALLAIPPKATDQVAVTMSREDIGRITLLVLVVLPLAAVILGMAVWVKRRR
ncbi:MAG: GldG family protein [Thermoanaerobaculia bacterium]